MRRPTIAALVVVVGSLLLADYLVVNESLGDLAMLAVDAAILVAAGAALIDDVIDPRQTRPVLIRGLEMARGKRVQHPWRKHGVMPV